MDKETENNLRNEQGQLRALRDDARAENATILEEIKRLEAERAAATPSPSTPAPIITPTPSAPTPPSGPSSTERAKKVGATKTPEQTQEVETGLNNIGFKLDKWKNNFFAKTFDAIAQANLKRHKGKENAVTSWCSELRDSFTRDAEKSLKRAQDAKEGKSNLKMKLLNPAMFVGIIAKYGRLATGVSPLSMVLTAGMAAARGTDAAKEARLKKEGVIEKTRISKNNINLAIDEAWKIYTRAQQNANDSSGIDLSAKALKAAYLREMPKNILKRLENPKVASGVVQGLVKKEIHFNVQRLDNIVTKIESDKNLSPAQKEEKIERELKDWENYLKDYDRLITEIGTLDAVATSFLYGQLISKGVVKAATIVSVEKLFEGISHALTSYGHEALTAHTPDTNTHISDPDIDKIDAQHTKTLHKIAQQKADSMAHAKTADSIAKLEADSAHPDSVSKAGITKPSGVEKVTSQDSLSKVAKITNPDSTVAAQNAAPGAGAAQSALEVGHSLTAPGEFKIGEGEAGLDHALMKIIMDHHKLPTGPGVILDKTTAARLLNELENIKRVLGGQTTNGITPGQLHEGLQIHDKLITINPKLNSTLDHFLRHSKDLENTGTFNDPESAIAYIKNRSWLEDLRGDGAHDAGIVGHPDATESSIEDFSKIPGPHNTTEAAAKTVGDTPYGISKDITNPPSSAKTLTPEQALEGIQPAPGTPNTINIANENRNFSFFGRSTSSATSEIKVPGAEPENIIPVGIAGNTYGLSPEMFKEVGTLYDKNIHHLFPSNTEDSWLKIQDQAAIDIVNLKEDMVSAADKPLWDYFAKIREVLGEEFLPLTGGTLMDPRPETIAEFTQRALATAGYTSKYTLDSLDLTK